MATALRSEVQAAVHAFHVQLDERGDDSYRRRLRETIVGALDGGEEHVVVDCMAWKTLDLPLLSTLIQCANACDSRGAVFEVMNLSATLRSDITALHLAPRLGLVQ